MRIEFGTRWMEVNFSEKVEQPGSNELFELLEYVNKFNVAHPNRLIGVDIQKEGVLWKLKLRYV